MFLVAAADIHRQQPDVKSPGHGSCCFEKSLPG